MTVITLYEVKKMNKKERLRTVFLEKVNEVIENRKMDVTRLTKENRLDEANLEKVKLNVIEIFKQMYEITHSKSKDTFNREHYLQLLTKIKTPWEVKRQKAEHYGDTLNVVLENIKLDEATYIMSIFDELYLEIEGE